MKNNYNVVGDIAGQYLTLKALLAKMHQDAELISLGDPNDRGPRSKEVIEFLMKNGKTVQSNHAHMLIEMWKQSAMPGANPRFYDNKVFFYNGGIQALDSYDPDWKTKASFTATKNMYNEWHFDFKEEVLHTLIPAEHIKFLESCPTFIRSEDFVMSHAPIRMNSTAEQASNLGTGFANFSMDYYSEYSIIWNRYVPERPNPAEPRVNVFGHNSSNQVKMFTTQFPAGVKVDNEKFQEIWARRDQYPVYAICIDTSSGKKLTGLHLPSMTLYEQEYID